MVGNPDRARRLQGKLEARIRGGKQHAILQFPAISPTMLPQLKHGNGYSAGPNLTRTSLRLDEKSFQDLLSAALGVDLGAVGKQQLSNVPMASPDDQARIEDGDSRIVRRRFLCRTEQGS